MAHITLESFNSIVSIEDYLDENPTPVKTKKFFTVENDDGYACEYEEELEKVVAKENPTFSQFQIKNKCQEIIKKTFQKNKEHLHQEEINKLNISIENVKNITLRDSMFPNLLYIISDEIEKNNTFKNLCLNYYISDAWNEKDLGIAAKYNDTTNDLINTKMQKILPLYIMAAYGRSDISSGDKDIYSNKHFRCYGKRLNNLMNFHTIYSLFNPKFTSTSTKYITNLRNYSTKKRYEKFCELNPDEKWKIQLDFDQDSVIFRFRNSQDISQLVYINCIDSWFISDNTKYKFESISEIIRHIITFERIRN